MTAKAAPLPSLADSSLLARSMRGFLGKAGITMFAVVVLSAYLLPLLFMVTTSLQQTGQRSTPGAPIYPAVPATAQYEGKSYPMYVVPIDGENRSLILVKPGREHSTFIDPGDAAPTPIEWDGRWRTLEQVWQFSPQWQNYLDVWKQLDFPKFFFNTAVVAFISTIGAVASAILVAFGFARFRFKGSNALFVVLLATIILPFQVTLIPQYAIFSALGWVGTWLPLIVPHFFANAFNVFLLRQYFMSIPRDLDEAAMMDGAGPLRILRSVIIPLSIPAILAVALFHFFFSWNDFFVPLLYLSSKPDLQTLPIALQIQFNAQYATQPTLLQASALMTMAVPVVVFLLAQRAFMRGVVITGVEK
jgi:multiple sugar transport system permease protein